MDRQTEPQAFRHFPIKLPPSHYVNTRLIIVDQLVRLVRQLANMLVDVANLLNFCLFC